MPATSPQQPVRKGKVQGRRPKHVPLRMCVTCRERSAKRSLVRIVRTPELQVVIDPTGKLNGRGAYLCENRPCWERALSIGSLGRALKIDLDGDTIERLRIHAERLPIADGDSNETSQNRALGRNELNNV